MRSRPRLDSLALILLALLSIIAGVGGCQQYDTLVTKDQVAQQRWANVDAELQRRYDLIPNLVATVKGSAKHEEDTLAKVTQARAEATSIKLTAEDLENPEKMAAFQKAQDGLKGALSRLLMVQEQYPDLKANAEFHALQIQLEATENRVLRAREEYNGAVSDYNAELAHVHGAVVNKITGQPFKPRAYFTAAADAHAAPKVAF